MIYLSWAVLYEGVTDQAYFDVLIPRIMEELVRERGKRLSIIPPEPAVRLTRGAPEAVAREACGASDAFHLVFIHADTGGRDLEAQLHARSVRYCEIMEGICQWPPARCLTITPRHETEAWVLADPGAVSDALGYRGSPESIGLPVSPAEAERITDPKVVLSRAITSVRGRRRPPDVPQILPAIAQRQSFKRLRAAPSFASFEANLISALASLGCV